VYPVFITALGRSTPPPPTGNTQRDHVTDDIISRRRPAAGLPTSGGGGGQEPEVADAGSAGAAHAQSTERYAPSSDMRATRRLATSGGSAAALVALALCAAMFHSTGLDAPQHHAWTVSVVILAPDLQKNLTIYRKIIVSLS